MEHNTLINKTLEMEIALIILIVFINTSINETNETLEHDTQSYGMKNTITRQR